MKNQSLEPNNIQFDPFSGPEIERVIPTTESQLEIWTDCIIGGNDANRAYNLSVTIKLKGNFNLDALDHALKTLVKRHESLRASFSTDGRFMSIFRDLNIEMSHKDILHLTATEKEQTKESLIKEDANYVFDLVNGPLFKVTLIKIDAFEYILVLTHHHIVIDGLSIDIILEELGALYSAYVEEKAPNLPKAERFSIYAEKVQALIESDDHKPLEKFWLNMYQESVPIVELPIDYVRPSLRTYQSDRLDFPFDDALVHSLKQIGVSAGCSLVTTMLSAFEVFLCQLTGQNDLVVGFPSSGNALYDMRQMIGHSVNLLPLRSKVNTQLNFIDYLKQRNTQLFDAYEHQQVSFGHLLKKLPIVRDPSRIPMVPVVFTVDLNSAIENAFSFTGLTHEFKIIPRTFGTFELQIHAFRSKNGPEFQWTYNTTLFKPETIKQMMGSFEEVINKLVSNPNKSLVELISGDYLADYKALNHTEISYPTETLPELLRKQAEISPGRIAIEFSGTKTNYQELHKEANQLAHYFVNQGIKPGDFIGVAMSRGPELIATLIAILQCGAAYVPLDPEYPQSRLEFMLQDSEAKFLITNKNLGTSFPYEITKLFIEDALTSIQHLPDTPIKSGANQNSIAYLLYTSGSTGKPKGVPISQGSLVNLLCSIANEPGINEHDRLLAITTISFDIAGVELYLPLLRGACVVMTDTETARDGRLLLKLIETKNISILQATPTTWKMLLEAGWNTPLKLKAFCGGEALSQNLAQELLSRCEVLWNMYGPTETTIYSIIKEIQPDDDLIAIGKPIANTQIYLLNESGDLVKPGTIGEITIAGDGVAQGYWKRPELTNDKFKTNTFCSNSNPMLYRTGDLGKLLPTGDILCLGRLDHQVKIRGHRIELGEIEQTLSSLDDIKSAVVLGHKERLIAYVIPLKVDDATSSEKISNWKNYLNDKLPSILVPQDIRIVKTFPTTPNGKLDRNALLELETLKITSGSSITSPRTSTEQTVATIWKAYLDLKEIDIFSNFFELGGHSLIALQVMNQLEKETGKRLPLSSLFEYSTIEKFSELLESENNTHTWSSLVPIKPKGTKTPIYIVHGAGMEVLIFNNLADNLDIDQPLYGLQAKSIFNNNNQYNTVEEIAAHYVDTLINTNSKGPYALAGYSFGGIIAYEMAIQLKAKNKQVNMVGLFDTIVEPYFHYKSLQRKKIAGYIYRTKRRFFFFKEMTQSWENIKRHIKRKKEFILKQKNITKNLKTEQEQLEYMHFLETEKIIQPIKNLYHMIPQDIQVDLFRAKGDNSYTEDPRFLGWKKFALKGVEVHNIPGNHSNIFSPANKKEVARIFQNVLDLRNENF